MTQPILGKLVLLSAAMSAAATGCSRPHTPIDPPIRPALHLTRNSAADLEITGLFDGQTQYLTHADLATLPQIATTISGDPDFPGLTLQVTGVDLMTLAHALHVPATVDLIDALCTDNYRSHYPAAYIAQHRPILILTVDGLTPAAWAASSHQDDPGPYFIAYDHFVPAFKALSHADEPQLPTNITRLNFTAAAVAFGPITPAGDDPAGIYPTGSPIEQGFTIAKQNCLRCHFSGATGGTKSGRSWATLGTLARARPRFFSRYILNPKSIDSHAHMPANSGYDEATRAALTVYFQTIAHQASTGNSASPSQPGVPAR